MKKKNYLSKRYITILIGIIIVCCTAVVLIRSEKFGIDTNTKELRKLSVGLNNNVEINQGKEAKPEKTDYPFNEKELINLVDSAKGEKVLTTFGEANLNEDVLNNIQNEINNLECQYIDLSFIVLDINRRFGIAYNADWITTSESTIKAPFGCSLLESNPDLYYQYQYWFDPMIKVSDNYAYESLRTIFGIEQLKNWCYRANVGTHILDYYFPVNITVRDMEKFWILIYEYLNSDIVPSGFRDVFTETSFSSIYRKLGNKYFIQSKAGWYYYGEPKDADGVPWNEERSLNDAGIIYADAGPYILTIFSNANPDDTLLGPIIGAIDEAVASAPKYK